MSKKLTTINQMTARQSIWEQVMARPVFLPRSLFWITVSISVVLFSLFAFQTQAIFAADVTFTVNNTTDAVDADIADGICDTDLVTAGEQCSLRAAIEQANATVGTDAVHFNIPGTGPHTIQPGSNLSEITDPVIIDGYTQPGAAPATESTAATLMIELDGTNMESGLGIGLWITAGNSVVKGLVINRFKRDGININVGGNNIVAGNYIGTDVSGTVELGNRDSGLSIGSANNLIGGSQAGAGNIIAFNGVGIDVLFGQPGNQILSNAIYANTGKGIDLDYGPNYQYPPWLNSVSVINDSMQVEGNLNSTANMTFRVELFANTVCDDNSFGEGEVFIGFTEVTSDGSGNASFSMSLPVPAGQFITATAPPLSSRR